MNSGSSAARVSGSDHAGLVQLRDNRRPHGQGSLVPVLGPDPRTPQPSLEAPGLDAAGVEVVTQLGEHVSPHVAHAGVARVQREEGRDPDPQTPTHRARQLDQVFQGA